MSNVLQFLFNLLLDSIHPKSENLVFPSSNEALLIMAPILTTDVPIRFLSNPRKASLLYSVLFWVYGFLNQCGGLHSIQFKLLLKN